MNKLVVNDLPGNTALPRSDMSKVHGGRYSHYLRYFRRPSIVISDGGTGPYDPIGDGGTGPTYPTPDNPGPLPDGSTKPIRMLW